MLFMCTSRFDLEDEQRAMINEYLSHEEIQAAREERDIQTSEFDPISDNEEPGRQEEGEEEELPQPNDNEDDVVDLPPIESTQIRRVSSRKRPREDDDQWAYY